MKTVGYPLTGLDLKEIGKPLTQFVGYGGVTMTTVGCSYGKVPVETVTDGRAIPTEVTATSDGGYYARGGGWHEGECDEQVFVEVYSGRGREFHGYIDKVSRKLTQTG